MRALMCTEHGPPEALELQELDDPPAGPGQVVVDVKAAGLNYPDLLIIQGLYQLKPPPPFAPGSEIAGVVAEVGEGVESCKPGDRVMVVTGFGGFADKVVVGADRIVHVPEHMDLRTAGGFAFTYATSYHALRDRAHLQQGETLLVLGAAGGVGLTAVELGHLMGARVIAAASTQEKLDLCARHGASERIDYSTEDLKQRAKSLGGVDVVYDPVGGELSELALRACNPGGRHLVIGFASGTIPSIGLNLPLIKQCAIVGVAWGAWAMANPEHQGRNMQQLLAWHGEGHIRPHISETYSLEQAPAAIRAIADRRVLGKVVIEP